MALGARGGGQADREEPLASHACGWAGPNATERRGDHNFEVGPTLFGTETRHHGVFATRTP